MVYRAPNGSLHTAVVTPELMLFPNVTSGPLPSDLRGSGADLVVTSVNASHPGTGDPAAVLGGGSVTVSGHAYGSTTATFTDVTISGVRDGDGSQSGYTAAWRIGYGAATPGAAVPQALLTGFEGIPAYVGSLVQAIGQLFVQPSQAGKQFSGPVGIAAVAGSAVQQGWVAVRLRDRLDQPRPGLLQRAARSPSWTAGRLLFIGIEAVRRRRSTPSGRRSPSPSASPSLSCWWC